MTPATLTQPEFAALVGAARRAERAHRQTILESVGYRPRGDNECGCNRGHDGPCLRKLPVDYDYRTYLVDGRPCMVAVTGSGRIGGVSLLEVSR